MLNPALFQPPSASSESSMCEVVKCYLLDAVATTRKFLIAGSLALFINAAHLWCPVFLVYHSCRRGWGGVRRMPLSGG